LEDKFEPTVICFACHYCAYTAADLAGSMRLEYSPNVRIVKISHRKSGYAASFESD
jgi:coenzyme F420-reducing hydrogenase delta subunit